MDRLKSAISFHWKSVLAAGGIVTVLGGVAGAGYKVSAVEQSKLDVATFDPIQRDFEKRITTTEVTTKFLDRDITLIKNQMREIAVAIPGAKVVGPPRAPSRLLACPAATRKPGVSSLAPARRKPCGRTRPTTKPRWPSRYARTCDETCVRHWTITRSYDVVSRNRRR